MKRLLALALLLLLLPASRLAGNDALITRLAVVTVNVADYDEALNWYTQKLGLKKIDDVRFGEERWLTVAPPDQQGLLIALAKPGMTPEERAKLKDNVGRGTTWVFHTADCQKAYETLRERGVNFTQPPQKLPWGTQAILEDLYGNPIVLLQPAAKK